MGPGAVSGTGQSLRSRLSEARCHFCVTTRVGPAGCAYGHPEVRGTDRTLTESWRWRALARQSGIVTSHEGSFHHEW